MNLRFHHKKIHNKNNYDCSKASFKTRLKNQNQGIMILETSNETKKAEMKYITPILAKRKNSLYISFY